MVEVWIPNSIFYLAQHAVVSHPTPSSTVNLGTLTVLSLQNEMKQSTLKRFKFVSKFLFNFQKGGKSSNYLQKSNREQKWKCALLTTIGQEYCGKERRLVPWVIENSFSSFDVQNIASLSSLSSLKLALFIALFSLSFLSYTEKWNVDVTVVYY